MSKKINWKHRGYNRFVAIVMAVFWGVLGGGFFWIVSYMAYRCNSRIFWSCRFSSR